MLLEISTEHLLLRGYTDDEGVRGCAEDKRIHIFSFIQQVICFIQPQFQQILVNISFDDKVDDEEGGEGVCRGGQQGGRRGGGVQRRRKAESGSESRRSEKQQQQLESDRPTDESPIDRTRLARRPCPAQNTIYYTRRLLLSQILSS